MDKQKGRKEYVRLRLRLAKDKIKVAKILFNNAAYRDVVSKAYYAIFYAAKAFVLAHGQDPHTHKGVDIIFREISSKHKRPKENFAKMLSIMREERLSADYREEAIITKDAAQEAIDMAQSFFKEIRGLIK